MHSHTLAAVLTVRLQCAVDSVSTASSVSEPGIHSCISFQCQFQMYVKLHLFMSVSLYTQSLSCQTLATVVAVALLSRYSAFSYSHVTSRCSAFSYSHVMSRYSAFSYSHVMSRCSAFSYSHVMSRYSAFSYSHVMSRCSAFSYSHVIEAVAVQVTASLKPHTSVKPFRTCSVYFVTETWVSSLPFVIDGAYGSAC